MQKNILPYRTWPKELDEESTILYISDGPSLDEFDLTQLYNKKCIILSYGRSYKVLPKFDYYVIHDWNVIDKNHINEMDSTKILAMNPTVWESLQKWKYKDNHKLIQCYSHFFTVFDNIKNIFYLGEDGYLNNDGTPRLFANLYSKQLIEYKRIVYNIFCDVNIQEQFDNYIVPSNRLNKQLGASFTAATKNRVGRHLKFLNDALNRGISVYTLTFNSIYPYIYYQKLLEEKFGKIDRTGTLLVLTRKEFDLESTIRCIKIMRMNMPNQAIAIVDEDVKDLLIGSIDEDNELNLCNYNDLHSNNQFKEIINIEL